VKSQIYQIASVLTVVLSFVPLLIVSVKKLWKSSPFQFFAIYWAIGGIINTIVASRLFNKRVVEVIIVVYNTLDVPMMATILFLAAASPLIKKLIRTSFTVFTVYEIICLFYYGVHYSALKYALGIGVLMLMTIIIWQIVLFLQQMEYPARDKALLFIHGSLLFQYGIYLVVHVFDYFTTDNKADKVDKFLIYYISCIVALTIASFALLLKDLQKPKPPAPIRKSFWAQSWERPVQ
jgi:hypothetical protein